jgi:hypothetical protein
MSFLFLFGLFFLYGQVDGRGWDVGWDNNGKILSLSELIDIANRKDIIDRHK